MSKRRNNLVASWGIIILSVFVALLLAKTGILRDILTATQGAQFIGSFIAGMFFVSIFTAAPATIVLGEIAQSNSVTEVAILGGLGALLGDFLIFRFVRDRVSEDFSTLVKMAKSERLLSLFQRKAFQWIIPFTGALIIASPLPDEVGLAMLGLSKMRTAVFIPLSFSLNAVGIFIIGFIARAL